MSASGLDVSDHALLRYLERVHGIDVEAARREIIDICRVAASLGNRTKVHDGHVYVIDGCWVTTVMPKGGMVRGIVRPRGPFGDHQRMRAGR